MAEPLSGFRRVPGRRRPRPVVQGLAAMIAAVLILTCGLLAGRRLLGEPAPPPAPVPSRTTG